MLNSKIDNFVHFEANTKFHHLKLVRTPFSCMFETPSTQKNADVYKWYKVRIFSLFEMFQNDVF